MLVRFLSVLALALSSSGQTARDLAIERRTPPLPDQRARWAVVIGVSTYKYAPPHAQLKFAHRDAEEFAQLLRSGEGGGLPAANVRLLTEQTATVGGIRAALRTWLPRAAGASDVVYLFIAGHAVEGERGEAYFVAHDTDPQNLHATGISFREVNDALTREVRAATVILLADACHAGGIGWTSDPAAPSPAARRSLEALGSQDRSFLKLLAARPTEQSFEDARWGGGHGVFTHAVLTGLRGGAERERDGFIRASELIDYVARVVPEQTGARQNPRIAGNFDAAMPVAAVTAEAKPVAASAATLALSGPPATAVYLDRTFRGLIRPDGNLRIESTAGPHELSLDATTGDTVEQRITLAAGATALDLTKSADFVLVRLQSTIRAGNVLGPGGAWDQYRAAGLNTPAATALMTAALEDTGMECVSDYVQSTTNALKRPMFLRSADAFTALRTLRPGDASLEAKALFCQARAHIAANEFPQAIAALHRSLEIEPDFACSHNALGVALSRTGQNTEARAAFEKAAKLTPAWALPPLQIAQQLINAGDLRGAVPHLEQALKLNPKATGTAWSLARVHRLLGNGPDFLRAANATVAIDRNYAPIYSELGQFYESVRDVAKAAQAYDSYLLLAPNFADSGEVRKRVQAIRRPAAPPPAKQSPPTLRRPGETK